MVVCSRNTVIRLITTLLLLTLVLPGLYSPVLADTTGSIKGSISPAFSAASVKFTDGQMDWPGVISDDGLSYSIDGLDGNTSGSVIAEPAAGYTLEPETGYTGLTVGTGLMDFDFTGIPVMYTISGNAGAAKASLHVTGFDPMIVDESGKFSFEVPYNWSGFVVPELAGYTFIPENAEFRQVQADRVFDFTTQAALVNISGNTGIPGVVLQITGSDPLTSGEDGSYRFTVPFDWSGSVIPALAGYVFSPASRTLDHMQADQVLDFSASPETFTISGNTGVAHAAIFYSEGSPVGADDSGAYSLTVPSGWSGIVSVSADGFSFQPAEQAFVNVSENRIQDFVPEPLATATPLPTETPVPTQTQLVTDTPINTPSSTPAPPATITPQIKINSIEIKAVGPGTYDDVSSNIQYTGKWSLIRTSGPLKRTDHYTQASGAEASLVFNGNRVDYLFVKYRTRGHLRVTIDGNHITDLDLYSKKLKWRQKWTSPVLDPGIHTITITRLDGIVDLDAFIVYNDTPPQSTLTPTRPVENTNTPVVPTALPPTLTATKEPLITKTVMPSITPTAPPASTETMIPTNTPTATNTPTTTPTVATPTTTQSAGGTVFMSDFETGDFSAFDGSAGEIFGKGKYYDISVASSPAIGSYSTALTIGSGRSTAAYLFTYAVPQTELGVYSVDMYVPGNVVPDDWWNVMQWKSVDNTYNKPIIHMNILGEGGDLMLYMFYTAGGVSSNPDVLISPVNPLLFPTDRWVNITGIYKAKSDSSGYVEIYQDGVKVYDMRGFMSKPGDKDVLWSVNSYADRISPNPATIYVDNMKISGE